MKFAYSEIGGVFSWNGDRMPTLVIENQSFFRKFISDMYSSLNGEPTHAVLSKDNKTVNWSKNAEIISDFINFDINQKSLIGKICAALERQSVLPENYSRTNELLADIENEIAKWASDFPCNISPTKVSASGIIKASGIEIADDYVGEKGNVEKLIDYMELVREFDRDKLFITVNMRCFFSDETVKQFLKTSLSHGFRVFMLEAVSYPLLKEEDRLTVDADLCEF